MVTANEYPTQKAELSPSERASKKDPLRYAPSPENPCSIIYPTGSLTPSLTPIGCFGNCENCDLYYELLKLSLSVVFYRH